jgi:hypothetical protein
MMVMIVFGEEKGKAAMHFTSGVRRREEPEAAAPMELGSRAWSDALRVQKGGAGARVRA